MKSWQVADEIRQDPELARIVDGARGLLEEEIGPAAGQVDASWSLTRTHSGAKQLVLRLSDWTWPKGVEAFLTSSEVAAKSRLRSTLHWLWGDLLQARNHEQLRKLQEASAE